MLEHRYTNFTIMIMIKVKVSDRHEMTDVRSWDGTPCNCKPPLGRNQPPFVISYVDYLV